MKLYFTTRQIPQLKHLPFGDRMQAMRDAEKRLTPPEKLLLNLLKLLIIVPAFALILRASDDWWALVWAALLILAYPLVLTPIQHSFCAKHLKTEQTQGDV
ncbi:DUF6170 family protein [Aestuariibacter halophilus]|uniref:DUF6170 family protein n=1 Tax=Fluctibacter halophilus TaxID=226011 RepID=A0ABS8G2N5_9ALTE|nr:DUF6170 family protein [Aestuariibacter halophilus]